MDKKPLEIGDQDDPIVISDMDDNYTDQSVENLLKQLSNITQDISNLSFEDANHEKDFQSGEVPQLEIIE
jgi:hypothetical protein